MQNQILVVDDDRDIRSTICEILADEGYGVLQAENGAAALDVLSANERKLPGLIILDMMMPVVDGWGFRAKQLEDSRFAKIPILILTADGHASEKGAKLRADGSLVKPISLNKLLDAVGRFF